ncbi:hypothetical protein TSAR_004351 [Trichomalopsis sarcophagae]|uniref:Uncharacterized protein n=1 Tax=Trichomalopsis sarcophagae TaxID=543379 RepID=A0A232ERC3_9HYME|nr:hypothetical protein TSAR_004351 [Trichomalopsis sarcophagae]
MEFPVTFAILLLCASSCLAKPYHRPPGYYAPAPVGHDGRVVDTPEVAQAKADHLAAFSKIAARPVALYPGADHYTAGAAPAAAYGPYSNPGYFSSRIQHGAYPYRGPPAPLAHDGRVLDTPEVAQAKAAHFAAFSQAASRVYDVPQASNQNAYHHQQSAEDYDSGAYHANNDDDDGSGSAEGYYDGQASVPYQGPPAPLAQDGRVIDTPEVAQAKAAHLAALQRASSQQAAYTAPRPYYADY